MQMLKSVRKSVHTVSKRVSRPSNAHDTVICCGVKRKHPNQNASGAIVHYTFINSINVRQFDSIAFFCL